LYSFEPLSKRMKKREKLGTSDVYLYDVLPSKFRIQIIHIWNDALGQVATYNQQQGHMEKSWFWAHLSKIIIREFGLLEIMPEVEATIQDKYNAYFLATNVEEALDMVDLSFHVIDKNIRSYGMRNHWKVILEADDAIDELNRQFREHDIGYTFEGGELIRIDSQYIHSEVVKPAISLLQEVGFQGAEEEFFKAHKHYRSGDNKEAVVNALKAFESTMKAICDVQEWSYDSTAPASKLIGIILDKDKQFLPLMLEGSLTGLATIRNKTSGHGQGIEVVDVPQYLASYALHMAASNIVLLVEAHKAKMSVY